MQNSLPSPARCHGTRGRRYRVALGVGLGGMLVLAAAQQARATPMQLLLTAHDDTTNTTYANSYTDAGTPNTISVPGGTQGDITFTFENSTSTMGPPYDILSTSSTTVSNNSTTDTYTMTAVLSGQNFVPPDNAVQITANGGFTSDPTGVLTTKYYDDPANTLGASSTTDTPGNLVYTYSNPASGSPLTSTFSYTSPLTLLANPDSNPFSMTIEWTFTLTPRGSLTNRGQTETKTFVPEPGSLALLGVGMIGLAIIPARRKRL